MTALAQDVAMSPGSAVIERFSPGDISENPFFSNSYVNSFDVSHFNKPLAKKHDGVAEMPYF